jgi:hypothetical protein
MRTVAGVTEYTSEMFARAGELLIEGALELAAAYLSLLNGQDTETDTHVERVAHESKGFVAHGANLVAAPEASQRLLVGRAGWTVPFWDGGVAGTRCPRE